MIALKKFREENGIKQSELQSLFGCSQPFISRLENGKETITNLHFKLLNDKYGEDLIKRYLTFQDNSEKRLIPFYDDVTTIGGTNGLTANMQSVSAASEYIDTGDWFRDATAAIRHYGDSMTEYPPGCILALKEVNEWQLLLWGKDYVIETNEYRITKCVQSGIDKEHITAYSSNVETYPDGRLKHEPQDIAWKDIRRIFLVLGYVVKNNGGTIVYNNQNK